MSLKEFFDKFQVYIYLIGIGIAIVTGAVIWGNLPKRVEVVEFKMVEQRDEVQQLAANVDKFVAVQAEQQKSQDTREKYMLKLIEEVSKR